MNKLSGNKSGTINDKRMTCCHNSYAKLIVDFTLYKVHVLYKRKK